MRFNIRLAQPKDAMLLPAVERSAGASFKVLKDLAWIADDSVLSAPEHLSYIEQGCNWVAEAVDKKACTQSAGGTLWSFLCAKPLGEYLHIAELSVRQERQGQGVGKALLGACMLYARQQGYQSLTLTTFRHVPWNMPLYAHLGFKELADAALTPELKAVLAQEEQMGILPSQRCAMQYTLF